MHKSWGSSPILVRILSLCFHQNFVWSFTRLCFWKINLFFFGTLCHHEKCIGFGLFVGTLLSLGVSYLISWYLVYLLKMRYFFEHLCLAYLSCDHWFCFVHSLNFGFNLVLVWVFDIIWTTVCLVTPFVLSWFNWCFVQIVSLLVLESLCMHIFYT